jgi:hypothetical protein
MSVETHIIRMNRVDIEHVLTSIFRTGERLCTVSMNASMNTWTLRSRRIDSIIDSGLFAMRLRAWPGTVSEAPAAACFRRREPPQRTALDAPDVYDRSRESGGLT